MGEAKRREARRANLKTLSPSNRPGRLNIQTANSEGLYLCDGMYFFDIGHRDALTDDRAIEAAKQWRNFASIGLPIQSIEIDGYSDDDPREYHQIPEAAEYVRKWARLAEPDGATCSKKVLALLIGVGHFDTGYWWRRRKEFGYSD
ncbi:MAG: hypothetical protein EKK29_05915 [Hyphomicrobiales bacterium]|nr:MAG: hypothetical protein EKK29_05915 [Hyphomicrobiales bacterium]